MTDQYKGEFPRDSKLLQKKIGYTFTNSVYLTRALTHSSYANEMDSEEILDNERLEFLGDAILGMLISDILFFSSTDDEGKLTRAKSHLVNATTLGKLAGQIDLGNYLFLGHGEEKDGGRTKSSILANSYEALLGAIYVDGGPEAARKFVTESFHDELRTYNYEKAFKRDYKSYVQELLQSHDLPIPTYNVTEESGPDHRKKFRVLLRVGKVSLTQGEGRSKKTAEQDAAKAFLKNLEDGNYDLEKLK